MRVMTWRALFISLWAKAMTAGHDCTAPVSGTGVVSDAGAVTGFGADERVAAAEAAAAGELIVTRQGGGGGEGAGGGGGAAALSLQKKVDGGTSVADGATGRHEAPFAVPTALEAMAAGRGLHSSTLRPNINTFRGIRWVISAAGNKTDGSCLVTIWTQSKRLNDETA
jgi:hypothetical protein